MPDVDMEGDLLEGKGARPAGAPPPAGPLARSLVPPAQPTSSTAVGVSGSASAPEMRCELRPSAQHRKGLELTVKAGATHFRVPTDIEATDATNAWAKHVRFEGVTVGVQNPLVSTAQHLGSTGRPISEQSPVTVSLDAPPQQDSKLEIRLWNPVRRRPSHAHDAAPRPPCAE